MQSLGGNGYINEYPVGRYLRDARLYTVGAGTQEIRRFLIAREFNNGELARTTQREVRAGRKLMLKPRLDRVQVKRSGAILRAITEAQQVDCSLNSARASCPTMYSHSVLAARSRLRTHVTVPSPRSLRPLLDLLKISPLPPLGAEAS
jgi:hypothetical protein